MAKGHPARSQDVHSTDTTPHAAFSDYRSLLDNPAFLKVERPAARSNLTIWISALLISIVVFGIALGIQWTIYDRYLHETGIRIVGSSIAAAVSVVLVLFLETSARNQRLREIRRLETIALLNHHIRNALQAIVASTGSSNSTDIIRAAVERVEWALGEVLPDIQRPPRDHTASSDQP
jgi:hypothetical protein